MAAFVYRAEKHSPPVTFVPVLHKPNFDFHWGKCTHLFCLWGMSGKCQWYLMHPELRVCVRWHFEIQAGQAGVFWLRFFQRLLLRQSSCSNLLSFKAWRPSNTKAGAPCQHCDCGYRLTWLSTLFQWAGASRRGAVSFRKVVPCTCHARIDPTPVLGFMSVTAEQLGIRDWTKQTSVRLLQRDTSHLTLDISGSCLHLQHPAWMNFMISGKKLQFSESDLSKVFETHTSGWK